MKRQRHKTDLRKAARGKDCAICLPGICNGDPETTVLAHIRRGHTAGMGQKPEDIVAVYACSACHDAIDVRADSGIPRGELDGYLLEALCRQLSTYAKEGVVTW